jgi:hypothetical protein
MLRLALLLIIAALGLPAAASALTWTEPVTLPASGTGEGVTPLLALAGSHGTVLVTGGVRNPYQAPADLTVEVVRDGAIVRRTVLRKAWLADSAPTGGGGVDLLIWQGPDPRMRPSRLSLQQVTADGRVHRRWSTTVATELAALGRNAAGRVAIAWPGGDGALRLARGRDGGRFRRAVRITGVLPSWLRRDDPAYLDDIDVGVGPDGRTVVAATAWHRPRPALVLATVSAAGRALTRQVADGVVGLVDVQPTAHGRLGVLVEDTGIEGEYGECVSDRDGRTIWGAVREAGASRFGPVSQLGHAPLQCTQRGAELAAAPDDSLTIVFDRAVELPNQGVPAVLISTAPSGSGFPVPVEAFSGRVWTGVQIPEPGAVDVTLADAGKDPTQNYGTGMRAGHRAATDAEDVTPLGPYLAVVARTTADAPALYWQDTDGRHLSTAGA